MNLRVVAPAWTHGQQRNKPFLAAILNRLSLIGNYHLKIYNYPNIGIFHVLGVLTAGYGVSVAVNLYIPR